MTVTAREALDHVRHALSTDQMPTVGGLRILNDAGNFVVSMHPWRWLEQAQSTLSLTAGQDYMWLPEDLREIVALVATDAINAGIHLTTLQEVAQKRGTTISSSLEYWAALAWVPRSTPTRIQCRFNGLPQSTYVNGMTVSDGSTDYRFVGGAFSGFYGANTWAFKTQGTDDAANAQELVEVINSVGEATFYAKIDPTVSGRLNIYAKHAGEPDADYLSATEDLGGFDIQSTVPGRAGGSPVPRLEMWPTPATSRDDVFLVHYRGGWQEIRSDNDVISVPTWLEGLYLAVVRAVALGYERDSEMDVNQRLFSIRSGPLFTMARQRDMMTQPVLGPMANGAAEYQHGVNSMMWNYNSVSGPS
jgi:hypothetical protein